MKIYLILI